MYVPHAQTFPYGVHAAVVDVSRETGEVKVRRIVAVDDCGKVLNEMLVEGQLLGSLAQGFGQALLEGVRYDSDGQLLSSSLMDYKVPTAADMPPVIHDRLEHPAPSNPLGVKGAGEAGCIGLPPAILNATLDALAPLGVTDLQFPLRPVDVWTAIQEATARG
jgi:carbon-monoxide dehydrogenase large subunit